jgi:ADP-heptose:LPS heptosyltransferase
MHINHKKILIMPPAGMGDLIMAAPVIRAVRNKFPESFIAVLAHHSRGAKDIGDCMPYIDEVIDFPLKRYSWGSVLKFFLFSYWPMFWNLRKQKFDTVINLAQNPIRTIIAKMLNPQTALEVVGKGHPARRGLDVVAKLGYSMDPMDFGFKVPQVDLERILPSSLSRPWIGIHPFSAIKWRNWGNYMNFIEKLPKTATVIILGRDSQHKKITNCKNVVDLVNKLSVKELIAVIAKLDVLVSIDSGPMHIGFAVGTPTLGIFNVVEPKDRMPLVAKDSHAEIFLPCQVKDNYTVKERKTEKVEKIDLDVNLIYSKIMDLYKF